MSVYPDDTEFMDDNDLFNEEDLDVGVSKEELYEDGSEPEESGEEVVDSAKTSEKPSNVGGLEVPEYIEDEASLARTYTMELGDDFQIEDDDEEDSAISSEERLRYFADKIIACLLGDGEVARYSRDKLLSTTNPRLFRDENHVLFSIYYNYRSKLRLINIDEEFIRLYLTRNQAMLKKARAFIDINAYGEVDGSPELGYIAGVCKHFRRLCGFEDSSIQEFETNFEKYLIEFKVLEASKIYRQADQILTDGLKIGNREYIGFDDSNNFVKKRLAEVEGLVDFSMGTGYVKMSELLMDEKEDGKKPYLIGDFGRLAPLNKAYGGIYTGMFYQIIAPPKGGKTKLCARLCHNISVVAGNNVSVWAQEGGKDAWAAQMRAIHFDYTYNTGAEDIRDRKFGITQDVILKGKYPNDTLRELEMSSKIDLATNPQYGSVDFIDRPFVVETFIDDIATSVKENNSKIVIIDYLQLIGSSTGIPERERVAEAYKNLLIYCKDNNVAVLTPGQYKQSALDSMLSKSDVNNVDMRSAGGSTAEVERTPDIIFALWASAEDLQNHSMKIISVPSRMSVMFPTVNVAVDLGVCQFIAKE